MAEKKPTAKPALLAGGNPQIAKGDGDGPVQAYIAAMPGWKQDVGQRLDALIVRTVPGVSKAVKWNSPFYGIEGQGWFLCFHCFKKYVKLAFFRGASLQPLPPGESKSEDTRYLDIYEADELDEQLLASWIRQAAELPGWVRRAGRASGRFAEVARPVRLGLELGRRAPRGRPPPGTSWRAPRPPRGEAPPRPPGTRTTLPRRARRPSGSRTGRRRRPRRCAASTRRVHEVPLPAARRSRPSISSRHSPDSTRKPSCVPSPW